MAKAKAIIKRRKVVQNTRKITRTMELVSTAKYKQSFDRVERATPYRDTLQEMMADIAKSGTEVDHPLLQRRDPAKHATVLLLTSNRGLCGGFNTNLVKTAIRHCKEWKEQGVEVELHVVGKKGIGTLKFQRVAMAGQYIDFGDDPKYDDVEQLGSQFMASYMAEKTDRVAVVYQRFHSAATQRPQVDLLLPIESRQRQTTEEGESAEAPSEKAQSSEYIFSPAADEILRKLLPAYFKTTLYQVFLETVVGEHRARMVAMKNATDNAKQMEKSLTRLYNRARQTQITNEISEIMGGVEALK